MVRVNPTRQKTNNAGNVGYEVELWQMADALRGSMDAAEYKHVVLGLIFLKYICDAFEEHHAKVKSQKARGADPEYPDEYRALSVFWVRPEAGWSHLNAQALILALAMVLERFHAIAQGLYGWVDESEIEFRTLAALRDTLLPKLISSELRLAGHEQFLEAMP